MTRDLSAITAPTTDFTKPEAYERHPGGCGDQSKKTPGRNAFSQPSANLSFEQRADFFVGNGLFQTALGDRSGLDRQAPTASGPSTTPAPASVAT